MMYARNTKNAENYIAENFAGYEVEKAGIECDCGVSEGYRIYDETGDEIESICVCNSCWFNSDVMHRIESPGTLDEEELTDLLGFEPGIDDVEIIRTVDINDEADFIVAKLDINDDEMTVPFIHYKGKEWLFTPEDWQGELPDGPEQIDTINWRVNNTETEGIIVDGLPRLAPWTDDPVITTRKSIGEAIREARESQGLSIRQLAEKCGLSKNNIVRIEQGKYNYTIDNLTTIANVLGIGISMN